MKKRLLAILLTVALLLTVAPMAALADDEQAADSEITAVTEEPTAAEETDPADSDEEASESDGSDESKEAENTDEPEETGDESEDAISVKQIGGTLTISGKGYLGGIVDSGEASWEENKTTVTTIVVESGITGIGPEVFKGCTNVTSVSLPEGLTEISESAFEGCTSLTAITFPASFTSIGFSAFKGCTALNTITFEGEAPDYAASAGVAYDYPFAGVIATVWIRFTTSTTWTDMTKNQLGGTLTYCFWGNCGSKLTWKLGTDGTMTISGEGEMAGVSTEAVEMPWNTLEPDIKKLVIEEGVTSIGKYAFSGCSSMTAVTIPGTVTTIGEGAFETCTGLTEVTIPEGTQTIGESAFAKCSGLTAVTVPKTLKTVVESAFLDCDKLEKVTISDITAWCGISFANYYANPLYYAGKLYQGNALVTELDIPDGVTSIGEYAFYNDLTLTSVMIPDSVTTIGFDAFGGCTALTDVYYEGTEEEWADIKIGLQNSPLKKAAFHYSYSKKSPFDDVHDNSAYYFEAVLWAVDNGITTGKTDKLFAPDETCTRAQVITFLYRAAGEPKVKGTNHFTDVKTNDYYYAAVLWGYQKGIVKGLSETTFNPDETVSRAQFVTFLYRYAGSPEVKAKDNPFTDVTAGEYYTDAVIWAVKAGVTTGKTTKTFAPFEGCTRGQVVTFLYRHCVKSVLTEETEKGTTGTTEAAA